MVRPALAISLNLCVNIELQLFTKGSYPTSELIEYQDENFRRWVACLCGFISENSEAISGFGGIHAQYHGAYYHISSKSPKPRPFFSNLPSQKHSHAHKPS